MICIHCLTVHGQWSTWSAVGSCVCPAGSANGQQAYNRSCSNPPPSNGGNDCDNSVHGTDKTENCNCPLGKLKTNSLIKKEIKNI